MWRAGTMFDSHATMLTPALRYAAVAMLACAAGCPGDGTPGGDVANPLDGVSDVDVGDAVADAAMDASPDTFDLADTADAAGGDAILTPFTRPALLDCVGEPSSVRVADMDGDGLLDLVYLAAQLDTSPAPGALLVAIAWGDTASPYEETWTAQMPGRLPLTPNGTGTTRDTSSEVLVLADLRGDQRPEILTAQGWLEAQGARAFKWRPLPDADQQPLQPVAVVTRPAASLGVGPLIVRGTVRGLVERCDDGGCTALAVKSGCGDDVDCAIEDLAVADFDGDGFDDVIAGGPPTEAPFTEAAWLWLGGEAFASAVVIDGLHPVDYEVGDIDADGYPDVMAQQREFISDFPSATDVWLATPDAATPLTLAHTFGNRDNHTDNAELADVDGDGCLDALLIGADIPTVDVLPGARDGDGCTGALGAVSAQHPNGWRIVDAFYALGVQQLDVDGDGVPEWVLRDGEDQRRLRFLSPPTAW